MRKLLYLTTASAVAHARCGNLRQGKRLGGHRMALRLMVLRLPANERCQARRLLPAAA